MRIHFSPDKKFFEFWKRDRYLEPEKDYIINHERIIFAKPFKGKLEFEYDYRIH